MRRPGGGSVSVTVTPYWTTLLVVVEVWSIPVTLPVARAPCIASKVTEASWPFLTFATSVSVNSPLICSFPVSAMVMKPLPVELELELEPLPDEEPPVPPLDPLLPELPELPVGPAAAGAAGVAVPAGAAGAAGAAGRGAGAARSGGGAADRAVDRDDRAAERGLELGPVQRAPRAVVGGLGLHVAGVAGGGRGVTRLGGGQGGLRGPQAVLRARVVERGED